MKLKNIGSNQTEVVINGNTILFSYNIPACGSLAFSTTNFMPKIIAQQFEFAACADNFNLAGETIRQPESKPVAKPDYTREMFAELPVATCIAAADDIAIEAVKRRAPAGSAIARWTTGAEIILAGRWTGKGMFSPLCARWITRGQNSGWFSKGLAGYCGGGLNAEELAYLPKVK